MDEKKQTKLLDQLESGLWLSFVKDRRPAEFTTSGLRTKNSIRYSHLKNLIDVPTFRSAGGSGIAEWPLNALFMQVHERRRRSGGS